MAKQILEVTVDVPEGWEWTGEYRCAFKGDGYLTLGRAFVWTSDFRSTNEYLILRLVEPVRESQFINLYKQDHPAYGCPRSTRESADRDAVPGRVGVLRIDYENSRPVSASIEEA